MMPTIRQGSTGDPVKIAKYLTGYAARKKATENYNADFVAHVCAWQRKNRLTPDGIIGPKTWAKIVEKAPLCTTSRNKKSAATCALQEALKFIGRECDGEFGPKTKAAVVAFQAAAGLEVDGQCGKYTWTALLLADEPEEAPETEDRAPETSDAPVGTITPVPGKFQKPVDYKQNDPKWGDIMYSSHGNENQTISSSGCGPTAMAEIVASLVDKTVTPPILCELAVGNGHRKPSDGTAHTFFPFIAEKYGFSKYVKTTSLATMKNCLTTGGYVVCNMGPDFWTTSGHFICAWKYDSKYMYANDPITYGRKKQETSAFHKDRKYYFCFWK